MGRWSHLRNTVGLLALGASLALASPGVNAVRADPEQPSGACPAPAAEAPTQPDRQAFVEQLRREHGVVHLHLPPASARDTVVLNTRGYNYGPTQGVGPAPLHPADRER